MKRAAVPSMLIAVVLLVLGVTAEAQQPKKVPRIGYLNDSPLGSFPKIRAEAFRQGMRELGYEEGKNIVIEWRHGDGKQDRSDRAAELVRLKVEVIVTAGAGATRSAKEVTVTIPIVMTQDTDPVRNGFVASLARPGGNITGLSRLAPELSGKQVELLKEIVPRLSRLAVFGSSSSPANAESLMELAGKSRLPVVSATNLDTEAGGLLSYGRDPRESYRRAATYVDKILKGAKPADLPVEQPTKIELVINLKTAKAIGVTIPQSVLYRADKVIK